MRGGLLLCLLLCPAIVRADEDFDVEVVAPPKRLAAAHLSRAELERFLSRKGARVRVSPEAHGGSPAVQLLELPLVGLEGETLSASASTRLVVGLARHSQAVELLILERQDKGWRLLAQQRPSPEVVRAALSRDTDNFCGSENEADNLSLSAINGAVLAVRRRTAGCDESYTDRRQEISLWALKNNALSQIGTVNELSAWSQEEETYSYSEGVSVESGAELGRFIVDRRWRESVGREDWRWNGRQFAPMLSVPPCQPGQACVVQGSALNLRRDSSADSPLVHALRIGTSCTTSPTNPDGWVQARCGQDGGWTKPELLAQSIPHAEVWAFHARDRTRALAERLNFSTRALALAPTHPDMRALFLEVLGEAELDRLVEARKNKRTSAKGERLPEGTPENSSARYHLRGNDFAYWRLDDGGALFQALGHKDARGYVIELSSEQRAGHLWLAAFGPTLRTRCERDNGDVLERDDGLPWPGCTDGFREPVCGPNGCSAACLSQWDDCLYATLPMCEDCRARCDEKCSKACVKSCAKAQSARVQQCQRTLKKCGAKKKA